jgi:hypothetical protein
MQNDDISGFFTSSISTCKKKILSGVEYLFLNPAWAFGIMSTKSAYFVSLLLRIEVKNLPTEETNVITVWRLGLWQKLVKNNVCRKVLKVILNMHNRVKSHVMQNDDISGFFLVYQICIFCQSTIQNWREDFTNRRDQCDSSIIIWITSYIAHLLTLKRRLIQFGGWGYGKNWWKIMFVGKF